MKVCHVNLAKCFRGGEIQTLELCRALSRHHGGYGIEQLLLVRKGGDFERALADEPGLEIRAIRPNMRSVIRETRSADIVHVHEGRSIRSGALASLGNRQYIVTRRVPNVPSNNFVTRWAYSQASEIVCVSDHVSGVMRQFLPSANVSTIRDCASDRVSQDVDSQRSTSTHLRIACIGEIDFAHKGQDVLAAAIKILRSHGCRASFVFAGTGKDQQALIDLTADDTAVEHRGWVDNVPELLANVDLIVHPARKEGLGSVLLEAMTLGKPAVASDVGGIPEIIKDQHNGLLTAPNAPELLAKAILRLQEDGTLLDRLSNNAKAESCKYWPDRMAESYAAAYARVASRVIKVGC